MDKHHRSSEKKAESKTALQPIIDNKTLAIVFAGLIATSGIALKIRSSIASIEDVIPQRSKQSSQAISEKKCNPVYNFSDQQSKYQAFLRDEAFQRDALSPPEPLIDDKQIVKNLNYCLGFADHSADLQEDNKGNKVLKVKDSDGKTVSEWFKSADSDKWQGSENDRAAGMRLCDSIGNIAEQMCNNGLTPNLEFQKLRALAYIKACPLTDEEKAEEKRVMAEVALEEKQRTKEQNELEKDKFERAYEKDLAQRMKMRKMFFDIVDTVGQTHGIKTERDDLIPENRLILAYKGQEIGALEYVEPVNQIMYFHLSCLLCGPFTSISADSSPEEIQNFLEFIMNRYDA